MRRDGGETPLTMLRDAKFECPMGFLKGIASHAAKVSPRRAFAFGRLEKPGLSRLAHNEESAGSNPAPAPNFRVRNGIDSRVESLSRTPWMSRRPRKTPRQIETTTLLTWTSAAVARSLLQPNKAQAVPLQMLAIGQGTSQRAKRGVIGASPVAGGGSDSQACDSGCEVTFEHSGSTPDVSTNFTAGDSGSRCDVSTRLGRTMMVEGHRAFESLRIGCHPERMALGFSEKEKIAAIGASCPPAVFNFPSLKVSLSRPRLDEYPLPVSAFRVYCHVLRRAGSEGIFWESIPNMAEFLRMYPNTVREALQYLVAQNFLKQNPRPGETTEYSVTQPAEWYPCGKTTGVKPSTPAKKPKGSGRKKPQGYPCGKTTDKVTPLKVTPTKVTPSNGNGVVMPFASGRSAIKTASFSAPAGPTLDQYAYEQAIAS